MAAVIPGETIGKVNPILDTFTATPSELGSVLADPFALSFQVFDVRDDTAPAAQVFPPVPGEQHVVDLTADKIGIGHFAAAWSVPSNLPLGRYEIRWFVTQTGGDAERKYRRPFEVLANAPHGPSEGYCLVADVREEGVEKSVRDRRIIDAINNASRLIEEWTGFTFFPSYKSIRIDGNRVSLLLFSEPICAIESLARDGDTPIDPGDYRVYARHLSQNLRSPDDRLSPKIELIHHCRSGAMFGYPALGFDIGRRGRTRAQEYVVSGVFGYTDFEPGGSLLGVTPGPIRTACVLLALRGLPKAVTEAADAFDIRNRDRVTSDRTREQTRTWGPRNASEQPAPFSGDPAIDEILLQYCRGLSGTGL